MTDDARRGAAYLVGLEFERQLAQPLPAGLHLVATPIGNLGDITLRALAVLARADVIYCEDTRHSRTLMQHFGLKAPLKPYHEHNAAQQRPYILADLDEGKRVVLISDAGTPLISDPGYKLVREVVALGHSAFAVPGPAAVLAGLICSGLPTDAFFFAGFLPPRSAARQSRLQELKAVGASLVFYEAPSRIGTCLSDLHAVLGEREAAVARELTKMHEEVVRGGLGALAQRFQESEAKGEFVIVVGPPGGVVASDDELIAALRHALQDARLKDAAKTVAEAFGAPRNRVYELGLKLKSGAID